MYDYDERLELAPRDVVSRAIDAEMKKLNTWCVYLDLTHLPPCAVHDKFPTIYEKLGHVGLEFDKDWVPVVPAQHYSCGGVATNLSGQTNVRGLYAAGEVAHTGVHGANRLASNSLLEALVFASAAAEVGSSEPSPSEPVSTPKIPHCIAETESILIRRTLQHTMTEKAGIVRTTTGLCEGKDIVAQLMAEYESKPDAPFSPHPLETRNLLIAANCVLDAALARKENVGLHFNSDLAN